MIERSFKSKLLRPILGITILIGLILVVVNINKLATTQDTFYKEQFNQQRDSFEKMKDRILSLKQKYNTNLIELWLTYPYNNDSFKIEQTHINLTNDEIDWVKNISKACGTEALSRIIYEDERILFGMDGNHYAFVYTANGEKPIYMCVPDEYWKWKGQHLASNWYYFIAE